MANPQKELAYLHMFETDLLVSQQKIERALVGQEDAYKRADSHINDSINQQNGWIRAVTAQLNTYTHELNKVQGELKKCTESLEKNKTETEAQAKQTKALESKLGSTQKACSAEKQRDAEAMAAAATQKNQGGSGKPTGKNINSSGSKKK